MNRSLMIVLAAACLAACSAPDDGEPTGEYTGPLMRPGQNCLRCHNPQSSTGAPPWTAAGTVYPSADSQSDEGIEGVFVTLTDIEGNQVELRTNSVGNFYTDEPLAEPFWVSLELDGQVAQMPMPPPAGSCNACHSMPPVGGAPTRIVAPGPDVPASQAQCADTMTVVLPSGSEYDCSPFACIDGSCLRECAADADCAPGYTCSAGSCAAG